MPYKTFFGGVCALTKTQMVKVNGFPNSYFGWVSTIISNSFYIHLTAHFVILLYKIRAAKVCFINVCSFKSE